MTSLALFLATSLFKPEDPKKIFTEFEKKLEALKSLSGEFSATGSTTINGGLVFQKPRSFVLTDQRVNMYCNGKVQVNFLVAESSYYTIDVTKSSFRCPCSALDGFYGRSTGFSELIEGKKVEYLLHKVDGKTYAVKTIHITGFKGNDHLSFIIDANTKQMVGWDQVFGETKLYYRFKNLRFNVTVPKGTFEWRHPSGARKRDHA